MENILDPLVQRVILESTVISNVNKNANYEVQSKNASVPEIEVKNDKPDLPSLLPTQTVDLCDNNSPQSSVSGVQGEFNLELLIGQYDAMHQAFIHQLRSSLGISSEGNPCTTDVSDGECDSPIQIQRKRILHIEATPPDTPGDSTSANLENDHPAPQPGAEREIENPFLNHIILTELFKNLPAKDLKAFRLVNKCWLELATSALLNGRLCKISLVPSSSVGVLNSCIETTLRSSRMFPCRTLFLCLNLSLSRPEFVKFFRLFGSHIKEVIIVSVERSKKPMNVFRNLLTKLLPKVEHVEMMQLYIRPTANDSSMPSLWHLFPNQEQNQNEVQIVQDQNQGQGQGLQDQTQNPENTVVTLPLIKTIRFDSIEYTTMLQDLLVASVNLKEIKNFKIQHTPAVCAASKIETVKEFKFVYSSKYEYMLRIFAEAGPRLEYIDMYKFKANDAAGFGLSLNHAVYLTMLLASSCNTIKRLRLPCLGFLNEVNFHCLPNLKELCIFDLGEPIVPGNGFDAIIFRVVFPQWLMVNQMFPNLEKITLELRIFTESTIEKYFPSIDYDENEVLSGIQCLELAGKFDQAGLDLLAKKFPNVSTLKIGNAGDYYVDYKALWYLPWTKLETLELHGIALRGVPNSKSLSGQSSCSYNAGQPCSIDSFITGIPDVMCTRLLSMGIGTGPGNDLNQCCFSMLQVQPSITSLQDLKRVKIYLDHPRNSKWAKVNSSANDSSNLEISHLLTKYGFNRMPKLERVTFVYDHNASNAHDIASLLNPLISDSNNFVTSSHESINFTESDFYKTCHSMSNQHPVCECCNESSSSSSDSSAEDFAQ